MNDAKNKAIDQKKIGYISPTRKCEYCGKRGTTTTWRERAKSADNPERKMVTVAHCNSCNY